MTHVIDFFVGLLCCLAFICCGLWAQEAHGAQPEVHCTADDPCLVSCPDERAWTLIVVTPPSITVDGSFLIRCDDGVTQTDALEIRFVPEPRGQLLVGLAGLWVLGRGRCSE